MPTRTAQEKDFLERLEDAAFQSHTSNVERFEAFPAWVPRQNMARFLAQYEIFKLVLNVHGSIVEGGVAFGGGLFAWAQLSAIFEGVNHTRRCVGFDTFEGFPGMSKDDAGAESGLAYAGGMAAPVDEELRNQAAIHDMNRPVGHIPKIELIKGDACKTIPRFVKDRPEFVCSLLCLDFDIAAPTKVALKTFLPRMPKGGVVVWDELNCKDWPGETVASLPYVRDMWLRRFPFASTISYAVKQ